MTWSDEAVHSTDAFQRIAVTKHALLQARVPGIQTVYLNCSKAAMRSVPSNDSRDAYHRLIILPKPVIHVLFTAHWDTIPAFVFHLPSTNWFTSLPTLLLLQMALCTGTRGFCTPSFHFHLSPTLTWIPTKSTQCHFKTTFNSVFYMHKGYLTAVLTAKFVFTETGSFFT